MKTLLTAATVALTILPIVAAPRGQRKTTQQPAQNHVPYSLTGERLIHPKTFTRNHVIIVNVDDAIPPKMWPNVVTYAASRVNINIWTNSLPASIVSACVAEPLAFRKNFGEKARVAVFIEKGTDGQAFCMGAPGYWSRIYVNDLQKGTPSEQTLMDRYAKAILRGLAYASGGGATIERLCSLYGAAQTPEQMDKTNIAISPMAYFPMTDVLGAIGGEEILNPFFDEQ